MELVAKQLADALLEDGESPKKFFKHLQRQRAAQAAKQNQRYVPPPVHTEPCQEWVEWDDLEDWQKAAALEIQAVEGEMAYVDASANVLEVEQAGQSFTIYQDDDTAEAVAVEQVEQDLNDEPGNFNQDWLEGFIDTDRLRDVLSGDVESSERDRYEDEWSSPEAKRDGLIEQDKLDRDEFFSEEGEELEITPELEAEIDSAFESFITASVESQLEDPMSYLADIYGREDAAKEAMRMVGFNVTEAAQAAVSGDGWQHFLARYDGNSNDLPSGAVYVRTN